MKYLLIIIIKWKISAWRWTEGEWSVEMRAKSIFSTALHFGVNDPQASCLQCKHGHLLLLYKNGSAFSFRVCNLCMSGILFLGGSFLLLLILFFPDTATANRV